MCELDIIFNFEKAYFMLDELILGGEIQETSKKNVLKAISAQDLLQEVNYVYVDEVIFLLFATHFTPPAEPFFHLLDFGILKKESDLC